MKHFGCIFLFSLPLLVNGSDCCTEVQALSNRMITYAPGVRGGITNYPISEWVTNYGAVGDGLTECYPAFTNAYAHASVGTAIGIPNGQWLLSTQIVIGKSVVFRGQSATNTDLQIGRSMDVPFKFGGDLSRVQSVVTAITGRSPTITVTSPTSFHSGRYLVLLETNDPATVFGHLSSATTPFMGQMNKIVSTNGNDLTLERYIYDPTLGQNYSVTANVFTASVQYAGFEDLKISTTVSCTNAVWFYAAANCWMKNVTTTNFQHAHIATFWSYACQVEHCRMQNHFTYDSNARYAISLATQSTDWLVRDNILLGHNLCISIQQGSCGNVIAENYADDGFGLGFPSNTATVGIGSLHGDNPNWNLWESNIMPEIAFGDFWGSGKYNVAYRNLVLRQARYDTAGDISSQGAPGLDVGATNYYTTIMGNVVGTPRDTGDSDPGIRYAFSEITGGGTQIEDSMVTNTTINVANFDWKTTAVTINGSNSTSLCNSLWRTNAPNDFGRLTYPPIGPDVPWLTNSTVTNFVVYPVLPAMARFLGLDYSTPVIASGGGFKGLRFTP